MAFGRGQARSFPKAMSLSRTAIDKYLRVA
jgi:hypothetical protein